jgi:hypothetical protein
MAIKRAGPFDHRPGDVNSRDVLEMLGQSLAQPPHAAAEI